MIAPVHYPKQGNPFERRINVHVVQYPLSDGNHGSMGQQARSGNQCAAEREPFSMAGGNRSAGKRNRPSVSFSTAADVEVEPKVSLKSLLATHPEDLDSETSSVGSDSDGGRGSRSSTSRVSVAPAKNESKFILTLS